MNYIACYRNNFIDAMDEVTRVGLCDVCGVELVFRDKRVDEASLCR